MININRNNYEEYFLDFYDGQLSPVDESILMSFLDENPDLRSEFELFENDSIVANKVIFNNKKELKKTEILSEITSNNFDELCIARLEGDLSEKETMEFDEFIKVNPSKQKEYSLYELTKIPVESSIFFKHKASLKKKEIKIHVLKKKYSLISIAASIIILIGIYLFIPGEPEVKKELIVHELVKTSNTDKLPILKEEQQAVIAKNDKAIKHTKTEYKTKSTELEIEINSNVFERNDLNIREDLQIAKVVPVNIGIDVNNRKEIQNILPVNIEQYAIEETKADKYMSVRTFLASSFNKRVLKKGNNNRVELFDVAQAGVEKINRLTGSKMSLKRIYDENGIPDKTEFNSRVIAFSAPIKKD